MSLGALTMHMCCCLRCRRRDGPVCADYVPPSSPAVGDLQGSLSMRLSASFFIQSSPVPSYRDPCLSMPQTVRNCCPDGQ